VSHSGIGHRCTGCGSCDSGGTTHGGQPAVNDPITMSPCVCTATASQIQAVIQAARQPRHLLQSLCMGQAVASQPIEAAAVGGAIEYCALIDVVVVPSIAHLAVITAAATPSPIKLGNSILCQGLLYTSI